MGGVCTSGWAGGWAMLGFMQNRAFVGWLAGLLAVFVLLAQFGVLGWAQHFSRNLFCASFSVVFCWPLVRSGVNPRPLLVVCLAWAALVWGNLIFSGHDRVAATVMGVEVHLAVNNKDSNWTYAQFRSERGLEGEYFPIEARRLYAGESVTLGIARGPFWSRIESVKGSSWSGSANFI
jgi:hypothetical protein